MNDKKYRTRLCPENCNYRNRLVPYCGYCLYKIVKEMEEDKMPIEKTKLNILNRVIDFGADTEKKITALDIHEMLEIPNIKTPELKIILDLQDAIKKRETIAFLAEAKAESDEIDKPEGSDGTDSAAAGTEDIEEENAQDNREDKESEVQSYGRFRF